jgi:endonuclease I
MLNCKKAFLIFIALLLKLSFTFAQTLVINELDCDTPGIDDAEFVELKSSIPNFALDGHVLVFYNGSSNGANTAYLAYDLSGYKTDLNGVFLIGSTTVKPFPQYIIEPNLIQNGADAVALYKGSVLDFPIGFTAVVNQNLVDVLLYGTNDADAVSLIEIFKAFNPAIKQISEGPSNNINSIQRQNDGSYKAAVPSPRQLNDGSGILQNGLLVSTAALLYTEGQNFEISFSTERPVSEDLTIGFQLNNGQFKNADFSGSTNIVLPKGQSKIVANISLIDDNIDEGDEEMLIKVGIVPEIYLPLNNNVYIRIEDNDYKVANFGTPIKPTYGTVKSTGNNDYYKSINGLAGNELKEAIKAIVADPSTVRAQTYSDVIDILREADQNPENSNQVWLVYLEKGRSKIDFQTSTAIKNTWNREHTWPRSRGGFDSIEADDTFDGKDIYWTTNADSLRHANSDVHALRAEDGVENSSRGNQYYGQYNGPMGTLGGFKGDVARSVFFLAIRYNGLELVKGFPEGQVGKFGDLDTLLAWHKNDPPDDFEMNRNNVIFDWQKNRNPFIDHPELVDYIFGIKKGETWINKTNTISFQSPKIIFSPNPTHNFLNINGINERTKMEIYSFDGKYLNGFILEQDGQVPFNYSKGIYLVKLFIDEKTVVEKIVVE